MSVAIVLKRKTKLFKQSSYRKKKKLFPMQAKCARWYECANIAIAFPFYIGFKWIRINARITQNCSLTQCCQKVLKQTSTQHRVVLWTRIAAVIGPCRSSWPLVLPGGGAMAVFYVHICEPCCQCCKNDFRKNMFPTNFLRFPSRVRVERCQRQPVL